jgi:protein-disulfide isomerase
MSASGPRSSWRSVIETISTVLLILASVAVISAMVWDRHRQSTQQSVRRAEPPVPIEPLSLHGAVLRGDQSAKVVLIGFSEFECPYCGQYAREVHPEIDRRYVQTGKVLMAFRHLPLNNHRHAQKAAEAAECAGQQGRFWEMHDALFEHQEALDLTSLRVRAQKLGLNRKKFDSCLEGQMAEKVRADLSTARVLSISGTPTFLIGTREPDGRVKVAQRLRGAQRLGEFQKALDGLLARDGSQK